MKTHEIDLDKPFLGLDDQPVPDSKPLGKGLAELLAGNQSDDPVKTIGWCLKLTKGEKLELDASDFETFKRLVKTNKQASDIFKARILEQLVSS